MSVWESLSSVDCSSKVEKKGNLTYLSWAWAWAEVMKRYPKSTYEFKAPVFFNDGSCEVWVTVTVEGVSRDMWLPVMDNRNNAIKNPDSRKISDARMRCLTKCLAMFGLGHYIYAGEDLPQTSEEEVQKMVEWWHGMDREQQQAEWAKLKPAQQKALREALQ